MYGRRDKSPIQKNSKYLLETFPPTHTKEKKFSSSLLEYEMSLVTYFQSGKYRKGKKSNLAVERLHKLYLKQATEANITSDKSC